MPHRHLTAEHRKTLASMGLRGYSDTAIAEVLGCHRCTIGRERKRNRCRDGKYRAEKADRYARRRQRLSNRNRRFGPSHWRQVERLLIGERWSPEQISGHLGRERILSISMHTIYRHIAADHRQGGQLWSHLRCQGKIRRKRYGSSDSRGRLRGKRLIDERPAAVEGRKEFGHWEADTVMGPSGSRECLLTLVERSTGYVAIGKLKRRTADCVTSRLIDLLGRFPGAVKSITSDNGSEFHDYERIETALQTTFYFCHPYHSWERGTNENTNGLIREYAPRSVSMRTITQARCNSIALRLNRRPRKRLGYLTPAICFHSRR